MLLFFFHFVIVLSKENMFTTVHVYVHLQGAFAGTLASLAIMLWIGVGAYITKPGTWTAPISVEGCNWNLTLQRGLENVTDIIETTTRGLNTTPIVETASPRWQNLIICC